MAEQPLDLPAILSTLAKRTPGEWIVCGDDKSDIGAVEVPKFPGGILIASCNNTWLPKCQGNAAAIVCAINSIEVVTRRCMEAEQSNLSICGTNELIQRRNHELEAENARLKERVAELIGANCTLFVELTDVRKRNVRGLG